MKDLDAGSQTLLRRHNGIIMGALDVEARFLCDLWSDPKKSSALCDDSVVWMVLKCRFNECKQGRLQAGFTRRTVEEQAVERCLGSVPLLQVGRQLKRQSDSIINPPWFQPPDSRLAVSWRFIFCTSSNWCKQAKYRRWLCVFMLKATWRRHCGDVWLVPVGESECQVNEDANIRCKYSLHISRTFVQTVPTCQSLIYCLYIYEPISKFCQISFFFFSLVFFFFLLFSASRVYFLPYSLKCVSYKQWNLTSLSSNCASWHITLQQIANNLKKMH